ncbi:hypothetical protein BJ546DRAFT_284549 [Cryomyces antarcticus]
MAVAVYGVWAPRLRISAHVLLFRSGSASCVCNCNGLPFSKLKPLPVPSSPSPTRRSSSTLRISQNFTTQLNNIANGFHNTVGRRNLSASSLPSDQSICRIKDTTRAVLSMRLNTHRRATAVATHRLSNSMAVTLHLSRCNTSKGHLNRSS